MKDSEHTWKTSHEDHFQRVKPQSLTMQDTIDSVRLIKKSEAIFRFHLATAKRTKGTSLLLSGATRSSTETLK